MWQSSRASCGIIDGDDSETAQIWVQYLARATEPSLTDLTGEAILSGAFERLRPRLLAMIERRISRKLAVRIDPEGVVQEAYIRAKPRWQASSPKPADLDAWVYGQVVDRLVEMVRGALGPKQDIGRDVPWPDGFALPFAEKLVDSQTGPTTALSRAERADVVRAALERLDNTDREILALRYFDGLNFAQIGTILGLSRNAATKRGLLARVELRDHIPPAYRPPGANRQGFSHREADAKSLLDEALRRGMGGAAASQG